MSERPPLRGDEDELFRTYNRALVRSVGRVVTAPAPVIEDACQGAWVALLRTQPERTPGLFNWLRVVAVHHVYRATSRDGREARLEEIAGDAPWEDLVGTGTSLELMIEARRALAALAALPPTQSHDLALLVGGFSYREIARAGGRNRSLNNVNKHLTKARTRLRRLEASAVV